MVAFDTLKASRRLRDAVVSWCATMSWRQVTFVIIALTAVQLAAIGIFAAIIISRLEHLRLPLGPVGGGPLGLRALTG